MKKVNKRNPQSEYVEEDLAEDIKLDLSEDDDDDMKLDSGIKEFDVESLPLGFFMIVVAPRRSGKSEKIQSLLNEIYKSKIQRFDYVFLFSATDAGFEDQIPATYRFRDLAHLPYVANKQAEVKAWNMKQKDKKKRVKSRVLIVLDDMIGDTTGKNSLKHNDVIRKLAVNGRHLSDNVEGNGISVIVITQAAKSIPKTIRMQTDVVMVGRISNRIERQTIIEEFCTLKSDKVGMKRAYDLFDNITLSNPFRFICISNHTPNKRKDSDFISYMDGTYPTVQKRLFGDKYDWEQERSSDSIF